MSVHDASEKRSIIEEKKRGREEAWDDTRHPAKKQLIRYGHAERPRGKERAAF